MKSTPKPRKRAGVLVRFYPQDILLLNRVAASTGVPREAYIKRCVLAQLAVDDAIAPQLATIKAAAKAAAGKRRRKALAKIPVAA